MNSKSSSTVSGALRAFQDKIVYFHAYNTVFSIWATLALIYYVVNTIDISSCSTCISDIIKYGTISSSGPSPMLLRHLHPSSAFTQSKAERITE